MSTAVAMAINQAATFQAVGLAPPSLLVLTPGAARVQVLGTFTGSAIFEETLDNLNWYASPYAVADASPTTGVPTVTAPGTFTIMMPGAQQLRLRCTAGGSGSMFVTCNFVESTSVGSLLSSASGGGGVLSSSTTGRTIVAAVLASTQLLPANGARYSSTIFNDSVNGTLYLAPGIVPAVIATGAYDYKLGPGGQYVPPLNYTGPYQGVWDIASGFARMLEYTK